MGEDNRELDLKLTGILVELQALRLMVNEALFIVLSSSSSHRSQGRVDITAKCTIQTSRCLVGCSDLKHVYIVCS
jgi:hypothetical protein